MSTTAQIQAEMVLLYTAPKAIENEAQARSYLKAIFASLDRMSPTEFEVEHVWEQFKREWRFMHWPTPFELCSRLTKFRQSQASVRKAAGTHEHQPDGAAPSRPQVEHRPYRHGEFMAALEMARRNAAEGHPQWGALDRGILRMGEALLRNRDDHDRERFPEAAE